MNKSNLIQLELNKLLTFCQSYQVVIVNYIIEVIKVIQNIIGIVPC